MKHVELNVGDARLVGKGDDLIGQLVGLTERNAHGEFRSTHDLPLFVSTRWWRMGKQANEQVCSGSKDFSLSLGPIKD
jgi:hypothetical protein